MKCDINHCSHASCDHLHDSMSNANRRRRTTMTPQTAALERERSNMELRHRTCCTSEKKNSRGTNQSCGDTTLTCRVSSALWRTKYFLGQKPNCMVSQLTETRGWGSNKAEEEEEEEFSWWKLSKNWRLVGSWIWIVQTGSHRLLKGKLDPRKICF